jgi:hypothetical protein
VYERYFTQHFAKYVPIRKQARHHTLILFDAERWAVSATVREWAKQNKTILLELPTLLGTRSLNPLDVRCMTQVRTMYHSECDKWMGKHSQNKKVDVI